MYKDQNYSLRQHIQYSKIKGLEDKNAIFFSALSYRHSTLNLHLPLTGKEMAIQYGEGAFVFPQHIP